MAVAARSLLCSYLIHLGICKGQSQTGCLSQGPNLLTPTELTKASLDVAKGAKYLEALKFIHRSAASCILCTVVMLHELH